MITRINAFDFDGVVSIGICPGKNDVIITGRCFDEASYVLGELHKRGIFNAVYFNPVTLEQRGTGTESARIRSGKHKATIIKMFENFGVNVDKFFEDDEIQIDIIKHTHPNIKIVHIVSDLVTK